MKKTHTFLGTEKISKLLFMQSYPAIIGMIVMSLYNIVDTIFIGRSVGTLGIASLAVSFPVQMTGMAIAMMFGIGAASIISRSIGAKKYDVAEKTLGNFFSITIIISIIITILGLIFLGPIMKLFGATDLIFQLSIDYMKIILFGTIFIMIGLGGNFIIRSEGSAKYAMFVMILSAAVNVILDAVFIFGMDMGIKGAALATIIAQFAACVTVIYYFAKGKSGVRFHFHNLKLKLKIVKETTAIGISSLGRHVSGSVMIIILNHSLAYYGGELAIAAIGIVYKLLAVTIMPAIGLMQGMMPIVGYNYGAKQFARAKEAIKISIKYSTYISIFAFIILIFFAKPMISIFTTDPELISLTIKAQRIMAFALPIVGFQMVAGGLYQSIGKAKIAFILAILRQVIFLIPLLLIIPLFLGLEGVFLSFPISDLLAGIVTFFLLRHEMRLMHK